MTVKAVSVLEMPTIDQVPNHPAHSLSLTSPGNLKPPSRFSVIGHRGNGMNSLSSAIVRENSILSFNSAAGFQIPFVEFDVQVTRDGVPIIFHDVFILTRDLGAVFERRVTDLTVDEFLSYGSQREIRNLIPTDKPLLRRCDGGNIFDWIVEADDPLCTLDQAFLQVDPRLGFNIELKFDDDLLYREEDLLNTLQTILRSVFSNSRRRPVIFSTFQPDAARIMRQMQRDFPVFFLTEGGVTVHRDERRNSLEEAVKLCLANGLEGIVSEVGAVLSNPVAVASIKQANLRLFTYGGLNNTTEVVHIQHLMGIDGVIVDNVKEISEAVNHFLSEEGAQPHAQLNFSDGRL